MQVRRFEIELGGPGEARTAPLPEGEARAAMRTPRDDDEPGGAGRDRMNDQRREETALEEPGYGHGV